MNIKGLIFLLLFFISYNSFSQIYIKVEGATGSYTGTINESIQEVKSRAIQDAKLDALIKAGISENMKIYSTLYRRTKNNQYDRSFTSESISELQGGVLEYTIINAPITVNENSFTCKVELNATVVKYETKSDYNYKAIVDGIKPSYTYDDQTVENKKNPKDGVAVTFSIKPTKDTYITIFAVGGDGKTAKLFPNEYNERAQSKIFDKEKTHDFGDDPKYFFNSKEKSLDYRLVIVMHKEERKFFNNDFNAEDMWNWILQIPRELRYVDVKHFTVYNNK